MSQSQMLVTWSVRALPLEPHGCAAIGIAAQSLAVRLLEYEEVQLSGLTGIASSDMLVILGDFDMLPWVDGVSYLGQDPDAPELYLPTLYEPSVPVALFADGLRVQFPDLIFPAAVLPSVNRVFSLVAAHPLDRTRIQEWLDQ